MVGPRASDVCRVPTLTRVRHLAPTAHFLLLSTVLLRSLFSLAFSSPSIPSAPEQTGTAAVNPYRPMGGMWGGGQRAKPERTPFWVESQKPGSQENQVCGKMKWEIENV